MSSPETRSKKKRKASGSSGPSGKPKKQKKGSGKKKVEKSSVKEGVKSRVRSKVRTRTPRKAKQAKVTGGEKVDGNTALTDILAFLTDNMNKDSNYSVALLGNGDLVISKVNGVTGRAKGMSDLKKLITSKGIETGRDICLAQKYNTALGSNHAEMCIVAAANAMGQTVTTMGCTGPNCPYCAAYLEHAGITSLNAGQDGRSQQGWAHPTDKVFWGTQVSGKSLADQVKDLKAVLGGAEPKIGSRTLAASAGKYIRWL
jgi:tRNA(Arg) A34 adenosine deaminase TadA